MVRVQTSILQFRFNKFSSSLMICFGRLHLLGVIPTQTELNALLQSRTIFFEIVLA